MKLEEEFLMHRDDYYCDTELHSGNKVIKMRHNLRRNKNCKKAE